MIDVTKYPKPMCALLIFCNWNHCTAVLIDYFYSWNWYHTNAWPDERPRIIETLENIRDDLFNLFDGKMINESIRFLADKNVIEINYGMFKRGPTKHRRMRYFIFNEKPIIEYLKSILGEDNLKHGLAPFFDTLNYISVQSKHHPMELKEISERDLHYINNQFCKLNWGKIWHHMNILYACSKNKKRQNSWPR